MGILICDISGRCSAPVPENTHLPGIGSIYSDFETDVRVPTKAGLKPTAYPVKGRRITVANGAPPFDPTTNDVVQGTRSVNS